MRVSAELHYPGATVEQIYALAIDDEFRSAVCEATHALAYDVDIGERPDGTTSVTVRRTMPADVPDAVKKFVGETLDVVQTEHWGAADSAGRRTADLLLQITGQPVKMTGTMTTEAIGEGVRTSLQGDLKVAVPFFGSRIEPEIAKGILAAVEKEQQTADRWLGEPA